ncbi:MAG TPA: pantoate--beta-alanine ligase [Candidatus Polarisedimenticolaceae bacterium]|nr:pantoate--beta-alanine ligase [Candidatus Polarisedimenticolaceae bacterium]
MDILRRVRAMKEAGARARAQGKVVGFVPTMGALHEGHLFLVRRVRALADLTVVSIFVNPTQFGPGEDFMRYPRDLAGDADLLAQEGVDILFAPDAEEIYPAGASTFVEVAGLSDKLEGRSRPGHFRGVATVVTKLFETVKPHVAAFGQKDAQQASVIKAMVRDLMLDVEVLVLPTQREDDGVAMSSRNALLSPEQRRAARAVPRALEAAKGALESGERDATRIVAAARAVIAAEPLLRLDYAELADPETLDPVTRVQGEMLLAIAVFAGETRLIDNLILRS